MSHGHTSRPLTASERIRLKRKVAEARREEIRASRRAAFATFGRFDREMRENRSVGL